VAETLDEALEFAKQFEPPETRATIQLDSSEVVQPAPDWPFGVYDAGTGHVYYSGDDDS
jgi:hypothetical protein